MFLNKIRSIKSTQCLACRFLSISRLFNSNQFDADYSDTEKSRILKIINGSDIDSLAQYDVTKSRLKNFSKWKKTNGFVQNISEIEMVEGFTGKSIKKLCDSILNESDTEKEENPTLRIKGQVLHPVLGENVRKNCNTVLAIYATANSVCWTFLHRGNYEVMNWDYHGINYSDGKKIQITNIMDTAWEVFKKLPTADIYVMKAESTSLRASGSDPNNPKVLAVNLQKAQMVAMIVALVNARNHTEGNMEEKKKSETTASDFIQSVYFLRPTLPFRLYDTLIGSERVSTDQTIEMLLPKFSNMSQDNAHAYIPSHIQSRFRKHTELQRDMMGHCLLLALTFMDVCIYRNPTSINKLVKGNS